METKDKALIAGGAALLAQIHPVYIALFVLIVLDVMTGIAKAFINSVVSSDASRKGMMRKAVMLMVVAAFEVGQRLLEIKFPVDMGHMVASGFCMTEFISILENAKACGVPVPDMLMNRFKSAGGDNNARSN